MAEVLIEIRPFACTKLVMPVPLLELTRQHEPLDAQFKEAFNRVFASNRFVLGPDVVGLEEEVAAYCDCQYAIGLSSGTDALLVALMALDIGPGDEVLCPSFTFFGTAGCGPCLGGRPSRHVQHGSGRCPGQGV